MSARSRDRRVYLGSHPLLFALLSATRPLGIVRLGGTVLVHDPAAYHEILTTVPLDRTADGTTGGAAARLGRGGVLFDQAGAEHRDSRRVLAADLGAGGVARLRPVWQDVITRGLAAFPGAVDLVPVAADIAGATACALTGCPADPRVLAEAALAVAAEAAREHLPGPRLRTFQGGRAAPATEAAEQLSALLPEPLDAMLAVAAVNTTVAALPRAAAWCARAGLWDAVSPEIVSELLRLTVPSPLLPRSAAADVVVQTGRRKGFRIRGSDRLVLVARHAAEAHRDVPAADPATAAQAVFGAGPHACPGANLARAQLIDFLTALAPHQPRVRVTSPARGTALPGYARLIIEGRPRLCA